MAGAFINLSFDQPDYQKCAEPVELKVFGTPILDSEELTDLTYKIFLTMMAQNYVSGQAGCLEPFNLDLRNLLIDGLYVPCVERVTYTCRVDQYLDGLPDHAAVFSMDKDGKDCTIEQVRRLERFPRRVAANAMGVKYKHVCWHRDQHRCRRERRYTGNPDALSAYDSYATVTPNDRVVHAAILKRGFQHDAEFNSIMTVWPALVFNAWADRRYLWQVRTQDHVIQHLETPLILGVAEEYVKSLFYARSLPVTETGRKRPILHWVKAHARRLAAGIDVDVRKHLRGITEFEMDELHFQIISPEKESSCR